MAPERLHRAGIAIYALAAVREAAIPLVAVFAVGGLGGGFDDRALLRGLMFAAAGTLFALAAGYLRWRTTTWWVGDDGAVHRRSGLISRKATDVPVSRIQAIDVEQGPVQRWFGVQAVHVQTGGGGQKGEIVLEAVGPEVVRRLRGELAAAAPDAPDPQVTGPTRTLTRGRLALAALTAGQFGVLLPVLAVVGQLGETLFSPERGREAIGLVRDSAGSWVVIVAALLLVAWLLSMLGTVLAFSGFTVTRDGDRLRIRRGLLARREATVPVERVRAVVVVEGLLRRPLGMASLRLEVIGHAAEASAAQTLFPLLARADVRAFLDELLPELSDRLDGLDAPPRRALPRYVLPPAALGLVAAVALWIAGAGPWALPLAILGAGYGAARFRAAGWRLADDRLAVRALRIARSTVLAPAPNRESHALVQTLFQRRRDLASLHVAFGKSTDARIAHLDAAVAAEAFRRLSGAPGGPARGPSGAG